MLTWTQTIDEHHWNVKTDLIRLNVVVDLRHSAMVRGNPVFHYEAQVETRTGTLLSERDDFETVHDAQRWCLETYAAILSAEMAAL